MPSDIVARLDSILLNADPQWSHRDTVQEAANLLARLPVLGDKVTRAAPGMTVWCVAAKTGVPIELKVDGFCEQSNGMHLYLESPVQPSRVCFKNHETVRPERCYPTPEAARAAKEATDA